MTSPARLLKQSSQKFYKISKALSGSTYYDPTDGDTPPSREIVENPLIFLNIWPGGVRLPMDNVQVTLAQTGQSGPDSVGSLRHQFNRWRALQKMYRDCGWGAAETDFDGENFERMRLDWVLRAKRLAWECMKARRQGDPSTEEQRRRREEITGEWDAFWRESAGDDAV